MNLNFNSFLRWNTCLYVNICR